MADHVFISYDHDDQEFVLALAAQLKARGVPVWIDQWDIPLGADWELTIEDAVYDCARFLIVLSPDSRRSPEVRGELRIALDENKPIVPILYRECRVPGRLRLLQQVHFVGREPGDERAVQELVEALGVGTGEGRAVQSAPKGRRSRSSARPASSIPMPEMIRIPAGAFLMGSDPNVDAQAYPDEQPQHELYLPDYSIARIPVTNAHYRAFVQATGRRPPRHWEDGAIPAGKEDHPVVWVTWRDARAYCNWLSSVTGERCRLPSEAEWEKAARGTEGRVYPWGDAWDASLCNAEIKIKDTTPVDAYPRGASPYGLLDVAGNVWEWTRSLYKGYPYDPGDGREDLEASAARVVRGGAFYNTTRLARCAYRSYFDPDRWGRYYGFRVVVESPG